MLKHQKIHLKEFLKSIQIIQEKAGERKQKQKSDEEKTIKSWPNPTRSMVQRQEFPSGSVVRTRGFHCRGPGFNPWSGNQDPASCVARPKEKKISSANCSWTGEAVGGRRRVHSLPGEQWGPSRASLPDGWVGTPPPTPPQGLGPHAQVCKHDENME